MRWLQRSTIVLVPVVLLVSCGLCGDTLRKEYSSPNGKLKASWFVRDCGATTDFSSMVSVHRTDVSFKDDDAIVFVMKGDEPLEIEWEGDGIVKIDCGSCDRKKIIKHLAVDGPVEILLRRH